VKLGSKIFDYTTFLSKKMKKLIILIICLMFVSNQSMAQNTKKPNIIFILTDDLGYGDLGCFGSKVIKTPNLDKLASEGVKLTQFYSGSTVCAPSRNSLLTGKHTGHSYIRGNGEVPLRPEDMIMPQYLKEAGYNTGIFGKWGLGDMNTTGMPNLKGWDEFFGFLHHIEAHYQAPAIAWQYKKGMKTIERVATGFQGYACDDFMKKTADFIKSQDKNKPFFAYLSLPIPHAELYAPKEAMQNYQDSKGNSVFEEKPYEGSHYGGQRMPKAAYAAMVSKADDYVGQVMALVKELGISDNTLIVFSSDNGTHYEGGRTREDAIIMNSSGGLKGVKRDMTDGGIRVPTIVAGAGLPKGVVREGYGAFWDFLPTFMEMAGAIKPKQIDGVSQLNYWKTGENWQNRPLYWEFFEGGFFQAVRNGDWKYIKTYAKDGSIKEELYNLKDDRGESKNLANQNVEQLKIMSDLSQSLRTKAEHPNFKAPFEK
jgi:arylsulfatase A-like enzyme